MLANLSRSERAFGGDCIHEHTYVHVTNVKHGACNDVHASYSMFICTLLSLQEMVGGKRIAQTLSVIGRF